MRTVSLASIAIVLASGSACAAGLLAQPETVPGETRASSGDQADAAAPGEARHAHDPKALWRVHEGGLPSLEQLKRFPDDPMPIYGLYTEQLPSGRKGRGAGSRRVHPRHDRGRGLGHDGPRRHEAR